MRKHLIPWHFFYVAMKSSVLAQTVTSVIRGTVQDASGAVLPVHVRLIAAYKHGRGCER